METLRHYTATPARKAWTRAVMPSLVLAVAATLQQSTRGPSLVTLLMSAGF